LVLAALVGLALLVRWWLRRRPETPVEHEPPAGPAWALALVAAIESEGRRRSRPRHTDETIVAYTAALADGCLPDDRVREVGHILSSALFGPTEPPDDRRRWAEESFADAVSLHPDQPQAGLVEVP